MKKWKERKRAAGVFSFCTAIAASVFLCGCKETKVSSESFERSDYYTRGIGQYPGNPKEDFSPSLSPDYMTYRNIALRRAAFASSGYDYNLTAQLATDGIVTDKQPQYLNLSTPEGDVPRREREWMIDEGPYSRNTFMGDDTYFQFSLANYSAKVGKLSLVGTLVYDDKAARGGYEIVCLTSADGKEWTEAGRLSGNNLPGEAVPCAGNRSEQADGADRYVGAEAERDDHFQAGSQQPLLSGDSEDGRRS